MEEKNTQKQHRLPTTAIYIKMFLCSEFVVVVHFVGIAFVQLKKKKTICEQCKIPTNQAYVQNENCVRYYSAAIRIYFISFVDIRGSVWLFVVCVYIYLIHLFDWPLCVRFVYIAFSFRFHDNHYPLARSVCVQQQQHKNLYMQFCIPM